jgi:hypothetical protein
MVAAATDLPTPGGYPVNTPGDDSANPPGDDTTGWSSGTVIFDESEDDDDTVV